MDFKKYNNNDVQYFKENFSLDEITSKLLSIRKIKRDEIENFLNPSIKNFLPNPDILNDMKKSTERTIKAIKNKEKIAIFGDYDVDGASATALLEIFSLSLNCFMKFIYQIERKRDMVPL